MKIILLSIIFASLSTLAWANPTQEVSQLLSRYDSFAGVFEQHLVDERGQNLQSSSGEFMIQRPGLFRWETHHPFPQLLVSNLKTLWLFDPDLEQVTIRPFSNDVSQSPALLLSGNADDIASFYKVSLLESNRRYELLPITAETFTKMELVFDNESLSQIIVFDSLDQTTIFNFSEIKTDLAISSSYFEFEIPEGVDVLIDE